MVGAVLFPCIIFEARFSARWRRIHLQAAPHSSLASPCITEGRKERKLMRYGCNSRPAGLRRLPSGVPGHPGLENFESGGVALLLRKLMAPPPKVAVVDRDRVPGYGCRFRYNDGMKMGAGTTGSFAVIGRDRQLKRSSGGGKPRVPTAMREITTIVYVLVRRRQ